MVKLTKIYTRGGDEGLTSLVTGARVSKMHPRIAAFGTVDEVNAAIGLTRLHTEGETDEMLARIQNDLFDLGADLATPEDAAGRHEPLRISESQVARLEQEIDAMNASLSPLTSFVLPGGRPAAAYLHFARTLARRAERDIVALADAEAVNPAARRYCNRLSDHLFVLARYLNDGGDSDVLWRPGAHR